jgi:glycosyltransferase involved in cell wall biosynthesis
VAPAVESTPHPSKRPRIGMLWGYFSWSEPPRKLGKMLSVGVAARILTRALGAAGEVVPFVAPADKSPSAQRDALAAFLRRIDVLWADVYPQSDPAIRLRHELGLPCVAILWAGGAMPKAAEAMLFPWQNLLRPGDGLLFTCRADRDIWRRLVRRSALHEWVVPLAVDDAVFYPRTEEPRAETRERHHVPAAAPLLLYVGRLNAQKNLHMLLRLLAHVRQEVPDAHLCLVGEEDDIGLWEFGARNTGYVRWLHRLAGELGVDDAITLVNPLFGDDLARLYSAADVLVNLGFYHRENFGLAQAEAQACGLPVVCTAWGGFKDVVRHSETGYLVEAVLTKRGIRVDWLTAAGHVVKLLEDRTVRETMSARGASWARQRFSPPTLARGLTAVIAAACSPPTSAAATGPTYDPSEFANRLDAHKRACRWFADPDSVEPTWYPPMFQGCDYDLYEQLLGPYATRLATELPVEAIDPRSVPYLASSIALDPTRHVADDSDPIWPQRRYLSPLEWEALRRVDGTAAVAELAERIAASGTTVTPAALAATLWLLHVKGLLLFRS